MANFERRPALQTPLAFTTSALLILVACQPTTGQTATSTVPQIRIVEKGQHVEPPQRTFLVTHGCGGTSEGDRFHQLATQLKEAFPQSNVYRLDWTAEASATILGLPNPWAVSNRIDPVADAAVQLLKERRIEASQLTMIGESFGVYVNDRIADSLGKVYLQIGCNPANEAGGYLPPDLRANSRQSYVLTSTSSFDTKTCIATVDLLLRTGRDADEFERHRYGMPWLSSRIESGDFQLLEADCRLPAANEEFFSGTALSDGTIEAVQPARNPKRPSPSRDSVAVKDLSVALSNE